MDGRAAVARNIYHRPCRLAATPADAFPCFAHFICTPALLQPHALRIQTSCQPAWAAALVFCPALSKHTARLSRTSD